MIVCSECGNSAPSTDGFCSACGNLLEWSGRNEPTIGIRRPATAGIPPVRPAPPPPPAEQAWTPGQGPEPRGAGAWRPPGNQRDSTLSTDWSAGTVSSAPDARTPAAGARPYADHVDARLPDEEAIRHAPVAHSAGERYDGAVCTVCGVQNMQGRTFCRNCGTPLAQSAAPAAMPYLAPPRLRWWQRLFGRRVAPAQVVSLDAVDQLQAPGQGGLGGQGLPSATRARRIPWSKLLPIIIVLALLGIGVGPARGWIARQIDKLRHHGTSTSSTAPTSTPSRTGTLTAVGPPTDANASSALGDSPGKLAIDGDLTTWWESSRKNDGTGESLKFTFADPTNVDQIAIDAGRPAGQNFTAASRPLTLTVTSDNNSTGTSVQLKDSPDTQSFPVSFTGVTSITLTVTSVVPGTQKRGVAIREVAFKALQ